MNGDGLIDILSASCDYREPTRLYLNLGDGTFRDGTVEAGLLDQTGAFNVRTADYDGDGDTDLDLFIYDENGNLIDSDDDDTDYCVCSWRPRWTGKFYIRIKNLGRISNAYTIRTN